MAYGESNCHVTDDVTLWAQYLENSWRCYLIPPHLRCVATLPCEMFQRDSAPAHRACETIKLLQRETPAFISPDLWPPNSPDLNPVNYKTCGVMQDRVYQKKWRTWTSWESDWLRSGPDCNRTWLTMPSTSGADACVPVFGLEEDILSICCDWLH